MCSPAASQSPLIATRRGLRRLLGLLAARGTARNTLATWLSYALAVLITLVLTPVVIHGVGVEAYGVWLFFTQVVGYGGLLDSAMQVALVRSVAQTHALEGPAGVRHVAASAVLLAWILGAGVLAVTVILSFQLTRWLHLGEVQPTEARYALVLIGLSSSVGFAASSASASLKGLQRFDLAAALTTCVHVVRALGTYMAVLSGAGLKGLALAALAANLFGLGLGFVLLHRQLRGAGSGSLRPRVTDVRRLVSLSGVFLVVGLGSSLAYSSDAIVIATFLTAVDVVHFGLAANVLVVVGGLVSAFTGNLTPKSTVAWARGDLAAARGLYLFGSRIALYIGLPLLASLTLFGPTLLSAWVGPELGQPSGRILRVLALAHLAVLANAAGVTVAVGLGIQRQMAALTLAEGVCNVLLSIALARPLGLVGVALGTLLPSVLFHGVAWPALLRTRLGIGLGAYICHTARPVVLPLLALGTAAAALRFLGGQSHASAFLATAAGMAAFWATGAFTGALTAPEARGMPDGPEDRS